MEHIFRFIWVALCAFLLVVLIDYINEQTGFLNTLVFPQMINFIHGFDVSAKKVLFFLFLLFFYITGLDKLIGRALFFLLGIGLWIILIGIVLLAGYWFLTWLTGCL